jgi:integrase
MASFRPRGKKPNCWWILTYLGNGEYDRFEFEGTREEAKREAKLREAAKLKGELVVRSSMTVGEWLDRWFGAKKAQIERTTELTYTSLVDDLKCHLGSIALSDISAKDVREYVARCFERGNRKTGAGLGRKAVRSRLNILLAAFDEAEDEGKVDPRVAKALRKRLGGRRDVHVDALEWAEAQSWLRLVRGTHQAIPVWLALCCGLRRGEILGLRRCDVDLEAGELQVRKSLAWVKGSPLHKEPKTPRSRRTVPIPPQLRAILALAFAIQDLVLPAAPNRRDDRLVWAHPHGRPYGYDALTRLPERLARRHGVRQVRFHDLRHTFATLLLESGVSMNAVSQLLGHQHEETTVRLYGHVTPRSKRRVDEVLEQLLADEDAPADEAA